MYRTDRRIQDHPCCLGWRKMAGRVSDVLTTISPSFHCSVSLLSLFSSLFLHLSKETYWGSAKKSTRPLCLRHHYYRHPPFPQHTQLKHPEHPPPPPLMPAPHCMTLMDPTAPSSIVLKFQSSVFLRSLLKTLSETACHPDVSQQHKISIGLISSIHFPHLKKNCSPLWKSNKDASGVLSLIFN